MEVPIFQCSFVYQRYWVPTWSGCHRSQRSVGTVKSELGKGGVSKCKGPEMQIGLYSRSKEEGAVTGDKDAKMGRANSITGFIFLQNH